MSGAQRRFLALAVALSISGGCGALRLRDGVGAFVDAFVAEPDASVFRVESARRTAGGGDAATRLLAVDACALWAHDAHAPLHARVGGRALPLPLSFAGAEIMVRQRAALCAFVVQPVQLLVSVFRPYVDIAVLRVDDATLPPAVGRWRVIVRLDNEAERANVVGACAFGAADDTRSCLIRRTVPFDWFQWEPPDRTGTPNRLRLSYTVVEDVVDDTSDGQDDLSRLPKGYSSEGDRQFIQVENAIELITPTLSSQNQRDNTASTVRLPLGHDDGQNVAVYTAGNVSCIPNAIHTVLLAYGSLENTSGVNATVAALHGNGSFLRIRIELDSRRFAVESIRPIASPHWLQSVERRPADNATAVYAVALYPAADATPPAAASGVFLALALRCRAVDDLAGASAWLHASAEMIEASDSQSNGTANHPPTVAVEFPSAKSDADYAIVPILKSVELLNTAALSGRTVTSPLRVLAASEGGRLHDVTDASHCLSADARVLKASPTCGGVYADGAERRGAARLAVHVQYGALAATAQLRVWFPRWPLTVNVNDAILNRLADWPTIRVLAAFQAVDAQTGESAFLGGDETRFLDVTRLMRHRVRSSNPEAVGVRWTPDGRLLAVGRRPGAARLRADCFALAALDCGGAAIVVTREPAQVVELTVAVVTDVHAVARVDHATLKSSPILRAPFVMDVDVMSQSDFFDQFQYGTLDARIRYSDGSEEPLADVQRADFALRVHTPDERAIHVRTARQKRRRRFLSREPALVELVAVRAISGASRVVAELRAVPQCGGAAIATGWASVRTTFDRQLEDSTVAEIGQETRPADGLIKNKLRTVDLAADESWSNGLPIAVIFLLILIIVIAAIFAFCRPSDTQTPLCDGLLSRAVDLFSTTYESADDDEDGTFLSKGGDALYCITRFCRRDGRTPAGPSANYGGGGGGGFRLVGSSGYGKLSRDGRLGSSPSELSADSGRGGSAQRRPFADALSFGSGDSDGRRGGAASKNSRPKGSTDGGFGDVAVEVRMADSDCDVTAGRRRQRFAGGKPPLSASRKGSAAEWVWLPSGAHFVDANGDFDTSRHKSTSIGSRYSRRSTLELSGQPSDSADSSNDGSLRRRSPPDDVTVSYRGSEISVSIGRQSSNVTVNSDTARGSSDATVPRQHRSYSALTTDSEAPVRLRQAPPAAATKRRAESYNSGKFETPRDVPLASGGEPPDEQLVDDPLMTSDVNYDRWRSELAEHQSAGDLPRFFDYSLPLPSRLLDQLPSYRPTAPSDAEYGRRHGQRRRRQSRRPAPLSPPPVVGARRLTLAASSAEELDACLNGVVAAPRVASPPLPRWPSGAGSGGWAAATAVTSLSSSSSTLRETFA